MPRHSIGNATGKLTGYVVIFSICSRDPLRLRKVLSNCPAGLPAPGPKMRFVGFSGLSFVGLVGLRVCEVAEKSAQGSMN